MGSKGNSEEYSEVEKSTEKNQTESHFETITLTAKTDA
jgi:hypothetical protein